MFTRMPLARVRVHAIDDLREADNAAQGQHRRRTNAEPPFYLIAGDVIGALRCVNENGSAMTCRPGPVLDIFHLMDDERSPRLSDADDLHEASIAERLAFPIRWKSNKTALWENLVSARTCASYTNRRLALSETLTFTALDFSDGPIPVEAEAKARGTQAPSSMGVDHA
jgi:hypothetical protein